MKYMTTNLAGTINVTNALLPHMRARRRGSVIIVGSRSAYRNELTVRRTHISALRVFDAHNAFQSIGVFAAGLRKGVVRFSHPCTFSCVCSIESRRTLCAPRLHPIVRADPTLSSLRRNALRRAAPVRHPCAARRARHIPHGVQLSTRCAKHDRRLRRDARQQRQDAKGSPTGSGRGSGERHGRCCGRRAWRGARSREGGVAVVDRAGRQGGSGCKGKSG
jgi:hypothetical protein